MAAKKKPSKFNKQQRAALDDAARTVRGVVGEVGEKARPARRTPHEIEMIRLHKEARASVALDGETQFCRACVDESGPYRKIPERHTCSLRPLTACEREVIEAWFARTSYATPRYQRACTALRAERSGRWARSSN
jgi:hypothetical protein